MHDSARVRLSPAAFVTGLVFLFGFSASFGSIVPAPQEAAAQLLLDDNVPKIKAQQRKSGHEFRTTTRLSEMLAGSKVKLPTTVDQNTQLALPSYLFRRIDADLPEGAGTFDGLPRCRNEIRYGPVFPGDRGFEKFDLVVYQFNDAEQKRRAAQSPRTAYPYIEGATINPFRDPKDETQLVLRALGLRCLPTALHLIERDGEKVIEYLEGDNAWR